MPRTSGFHSTSEKDGYYYDKEEEDDDYDVDGCCDTTDHAAASNKTAAPRRTTHRTTDNAADSTAFVSTETVLQRMQAVAAAVVRALDDGVLPSLFFPSQEDSHRSQRSSSSALTETNNKRFTLQQCRLFTSILLVMDYCHSLLLSSPGSSSTHSSTTRIAKTVTVRQVYYVFVTHFRSQSECNAAIAHVCALLRVPRHALGLQAGARGWLCGAVTLIPIHPSHCRRNRRPFHSPRSEELRPNPRASRTHCHDSELDRQGFVDHDNDTDTDDNQYSRMESDDSDSDSYSGHGNGSYGHGTNCAASAAADAGIPIVADWLLPPSQRSFAIHPTTTAECIVVIEKEGIYKRLVEDGVWHKHNCILITGKGFPDWATRACVHALHTKWPHLPVYGLADCDPYGIAVLQCYARGMAAAAATPSTSSAPSSATAPSNRHQSSNTATNAATKNVYTIPVQWMGLRPSQVHRLSTPSICSSTGSSIPALPAAVRQALTARDRNLLRQFLVPSKHESDETSSVSGARSNSSIWSQRHPFPNTGNSVTSRKQRRNSRNQEIHSMLKGQYKVELEALYWLGMDFCSTFVGELLEGNQKEHRLRQDRRQENRLVLDQPDDSISRDGNSSSCPNWLDIL